MKLAGHVALYQADGRRRGGDVADVEAKIAYISKTFVAYLEALMVAVSYFKTTGSRNRLELHFNKALKELNKHDDLWFDQYIARKASQAQGAVHQGPSKRRRRSGSARRRRGGAGAAPGAEDEGMDGEGGGGVGGKEEGPGGVSDEEGKAIALSGDE